jgi:hypothetical protein
MRKSEINSDQVAAQVNDPVRGGDSSSRSETTTFDDLTAEKSERICLEAVLPFLEEQ